MSQLSTALTDAEQLIYNTLVSNTGTTDGQSSFRGFLPDITNCFAFGIDGGDLTKNFQCSCIVDLQGLIRGRFAEYEDALAFAGEVIGTFPMSRIGTLTYARITSMPVFTQRWVKIHGQNRRSLHTEVTILISFDINITHQRCLLEWEYSYDVGSATYTGPYVVSQQTCKTYDSTIPTNIWTVVRSSENEIVWGSKSWFTTTGCTGETAELTFETSSSSSSE